ncbi:inner membrane YhhQ domain protein, partial [Escherichia coli 97.1742]
MNVFSQTQRYKALFWLSLFHLLVITSSNYLVQLTIFRISAEVTSTITQTSSSKRSS